MEKEKLNQESISVVVDWQKNSSKRQFVFNVVLVSLLVIVLLVTGLIFAWAKTKNHNVIVSSNMKHLQASGIQEADRIGSALDEGTVLINNIAQRYSQMLELLPDSAVESRLALLQDLRLFDRLGHVTPEGKDLTLEGSTNVADREYFKKGIAGKSGYDFLTESRVTKKQCVVFYAPIYANNQIEGVMLGFYEAERLNGMVTTEVDDYSPNTYLLLQEGEVIANSNKEDALNMLNELSKRTFKGDTTFEDIKEAIVDSERTSIMFEFVDEKNKPSVGVVTQLQNCDWMILSILPGDVSMEMIDSTNSVGRIAIFVITALFILVVIVMFVMITMHNKSTKKEINGTRERLERALEQEKKNSFIVDTLATTYYSVFLIDVATMEYERIDDNQLSSLEKIFSFGKWNDAVATFVDKEVSAQYKDTIKDFLDANKFEEHIGNETSVSVEFLRTDGGWRKLFLMGHRGENGELLSVICAAQKIDAEKQKELLAQHALQEAFNVAQFANNAKTVFLSNISHDIRTPMNAIMGMTMIAANSIEVHSKVLDCLSKIHSSCRHLLSIINDILDMSKIESGTVELVEENFDLTALINEVVGINKVLADNKEHDLVVKLEDIKHKNVIGDKNRLEQVFNNLLSNAIKYTPNGGKIEIIAAEDMSNQSSIGKFQVIFSDNGIGMSEAFMQKLFEPFTRAKDTRLVGIQGTGLGLSIARNIIRMMNGDIEVESELDYGSCFKVTFMLKLQPDEAQASLKAEEDISNVNFEGKKILLVEDNELNMEIAYEILTMFGLDVTKAESGKEAVEIFAASKKDEYDLIFMDVQMPIMNGYEATKTIRDMAHPSAQTVPIVAMTASAFASDVQDAINAGMNDHIAKPIDIHAVIAIIQKYVYGNVDV